MKYAPKQPIAAVMMYPAKFRAYFFVEASNEYLCTAIISHHIHTLTMDIVVPNSTPKIPILNTIRNKNDTTKLTTTSPTAFIRILLNSPAASITTIQG